VDTILEPEHRADYPALGDAASNHEDAV